MTDLNATLESPKSSSVDESLNIQNNASAGGQVGSPIAKAHSHFMKLPIELRMRIYRHHFNGIKILATNCERQKVRVPGILGVSREIRDEAMDALFKHCTIQVMVNEGGFRVWNRYVRVLDTAFTSAINEPVRNEKTCCTLLGDVEFVFRKFKNFKVVFDSEVGFLPQDLMVIFNEKIFYDVPREDLLKSIYDDGSIPYNTLQVAQTLVTCLRLLSQVKDITIKIEPNEGSPEEEMWILKAFAALRNIRYVQINDPEDYFPDDAVENEPTIVGIVALMKGSSEVTIDVEAEAMEDDWVALAKFLGQFDMGTHGLWAENMWEYLFKARVALFDGNKVDFESYKWDIMGLWKEERQRRKDEQSRVAKQFAALEARASGQPE